MSLLQMRGDADADTRIPAPVPSWMMLPLSWRVVG
jgi:hypothetical protein